MIVDVDEDPQNKSLLQFSALTEHLTKYVVPR